MDIQLSDEQILLQESVRDFLESECTMDLVRAAMEEPAGQIPNLWKKMAELGWLGLTLPEEYGGAELDLLSLSLLCREMGRVLLPDPFLSTIGIGAQAILAAGSEEQKNRLLPAIAEGNARIALAQLEAPLSWSEDEIQLSASAIASGFRLEGEKRFVDDAQSADYLLVPARTPGGVTLMLVDAQAEGLTIEPIDYVDPTRRVCNVRFDAVEVANDMLLGEVDRGAGLLDATLDHAKVALSAEMLGGAEKVLELSVDYAKQREQFGKPIGAFQAIQHKCADQMIGVESIRSAVYYAAWAVDNGEPDAHVSACLAKSFCGEAYEAIAGEGIQIHGGLGFTWEQDLHLYYKRAKSSALWLGDASWNRELAARDLLD